ncbi:SDR family oxidoreductase [Duganella aceris]|uniref:SDR family oxidoreductase n=1 Tax=Duganella aceris TaxID=2703883 RepID=UPI0035310AF1
MPPTDPIHAYASADTPMKRPGQPAELAGVDVLLASSESSYATGQVYAAVGGNGGP